MSLENPLILWTDAAVRPVLIGTALLGGISACLGCLAVVRRQSLQGDVVSHAALPGVALAALLGARDDWVLLLGGAASGWLALGIVANLTGRRIREDSLLGGVLASFFGLGLLLMSRWQRSPAAGTGPRLQSFLFGNEVANFQTVDLLPVLGLGGLALLLMLIFWKEIKLVSFDSAFAQSMGFPSRGLLMLLNGLIVLAVVIGLPTIGVVLMSALLVAPAVAARPWVTRLSQMLGLAAIIGLLSGVVGTWLSHGLSIAGHAVPTGPMIVLVVTLFALLSLLLRGLFAPTESRAS